MDRVIAKRYRVLEPVGTGGSSQVYLAQDLTLGRQVALKVLDEAAAAQEDLRRLFVKEGRALAQLSHPNVVGVHDVGEVDGRPYLVMELIDGISLKQRIERAGALTLSDTIRIATDIAAGLDFTHSRGIIHADLKPSNVLLDREDLPKICDFGIARTPQEDAETPQLFATALYVAPERVEGRRATVASDIYGLGLIVYEMLVGRPPFTSANAAVLLRDHVVRQPVPPSHLRPSLPKEIDAIVLKALAKDPALRWRQAGELAAALQKVHDIGAPTQRFLTEPIQAFVPTATQSPVVQLLSTHGQPIRQVFFGVLAAAPVLGLTLLAGFNPLLAMLLAGLVAVGASVGQLGLALGLGWLIQSALLALFSPALAVAFAALGLFLWLRSVKAEQVALALAMPVAAPLGLLPALLLTSAAIHGLAGVFTVAGGGILTILFALAAGRPSLGPFVQTGLPAPHESLVGAADAAASRAAILRVFDPVAGEGPFHAILPLLDPAKLIGDVGTLLARVTGTDLTALATILAWIVAALTVWTLTRLLRTFFDTLLRRRAWFALYVFATALGVVGGATILYMLFVTVQPLTLAAGRIADDVLFLSAVTGALLALAAGVVIGATEPAEPEPESGPALAGRRSAGK